MATIDRDLFLEIAAFVLRQWVVQSIGLVDLCRLDSHTFLHDLHA